MKSHITPNPENIVKINVPGAAARSPEPPSAFSGWWVRRLIDQGAAATAAVCRLRVIHSTDWITLWHALRRRAAL